MHDGYSSNKPQDFREVNFPQNYSLSNLMSQGKDLCHCTKTKLLSLPQHQNLLVCAHVPIAILHRN